MAYLDIPSSLQMVCKWVITYLYINGVYWGCNPLTNLLLTSWIFLGHPSRVAMRYHKRSSSRFAGLRSANWCEKHVGSDNSLESPGVLGMLFVPLSHAF